MLADLYFVRHGQTALNQAKLLQGRSDFDLDSSGISQAARVGQWFREQGIRFDCVFSSPLRRAVQTAGLISNTTAVLDDRLIEMDYGPYEGADLHNPAPEIVTFFSDFVHNPAPEGMEQLSSVVARTGAFVEELVGLSGNVLVSTHAIAMKGILEYLTPQSHGSYWSKYVGNCAIYSIAVEDGVLGVPEELEITEASSL